MATVRRQETAPAISAPAARATGAARTATGLLIACESHPQDDSHNHQAQQGSSSGEEKMAFDHARALW